MRFELASDHVRFLTSPKVDWFEFPNPYELKCKGTKVRFVCLILVHLGIAHLSQKRCHVNNFLLKVTCLSESVHKFSPGIYISRYEPSACRTLLFKDGAKVEEEDIVS